jgi:hypothetical protein
MMHSAEPRIRLPAWRDGGQARRWRFGAAGHKNQSEDVSRDRDHGQKRADGSAALQEKGLSKCQKESMKLRARH